MRVFPSNINSWDVLSEMWKWRVAIDGHHVSPALHDFVETGNPCPA